ncbi:MAG: hypothetical protein U0984_15135 [Prosthecobacter sp.]|nr:hypothetical protein [Prosthecobacter sp.]
MLTLWTNRSAWDWCFLLGFACGLSGCSVAPIGEFSGQWERLKIEGTSASVEMPGKAEKVDHSPKGYHEYVLGRMGEIYAVYAISNVDLKGDSKGVAKETLKFLEEFEGALSDWRKKTYQGKPCFDFAFQILRTYPSAELGRAVDLGNRRMIVIVAYGDGDFAADPKAIRFVNSLLLQGETQSHRKDRRE